MNDAELREIHKSLVKLECINIMSEIPFEDFIKTVKATAPEMIKEHILANPEEEYMNFVVLTASNNVNEMAQRAVDSLEI